MQNDLDWGRLRDYVRREIDAPGGYGTQAALAEAMPGFGVRSLNVFLNGKSTLKPSNLAKLDVALSWEQNSAMDVLRGGEPRRITDEGFAASSASWGQPGSAPPHIVRNASMADLQRIQAAIVEVFGEKTGEEFLLRALQLRAQ